MNDALSPSENRGGNQLERGVLSAGNPHFADERRAAFDDDHLFRHNDFPFYRKRRGRARLSKIANVQFVHFGAQLDRANRAFVLMHLFIFSKSTRRLNTEATSLAVKPQTLDPIRKKRRHNADAFIHAVNRSYSPRAKRLKSTTLMEPPSFLATSSVY